MLLINQVEASDILYDNVNHLLSQLSSTPRTLDRALLDEIVKDEKSRLYMLVDEENSHIVGMVTLGIIVSPTGRKAHIEDVVVDDKYRGKGLGREMMQMLIAEAKRLEIDELTLTSRPQRIAANALYRSLGFELRETNFYRMKL